MPTRDKTGPAGAGPLTGRGFGPCAERTPLCAERIPAGRGLAFRRGCGRGYGRGFRFRRFAVIEPATAGPIQQIQLTKQEQKKILESELKEIELEKQEIENEKQEIEKRLKEMK